MVETQNFHPLDGVLDQHKLIGIKIVCSAHRIVLHKRDKQMFNIHSIKCFKRIILDQNV
jgi:hypothetical protein